jgi:hypothetical protein
MNTLANRQTDVLATYVVVGDDSLTVTLGDGRQLVLPLEWYPRLKQGTPAERNNWRLVGDGVGIHWPDLDEDLSTESFLAGRKSGEGPKSLRRWRSYRARGEKQPIPGYPLPPGAERALATVLSSQEKKDSKSRRRKAG